MEKIRIVLLAALMGVTQVSFASKSTVWSAVQKISEPRSIEVKTSGYAEVAFSPDEGAEDLVIKVIDSAKRDIRMLTYSFTSAPVVAALVRAKKRNVDVAIVVDYKNNIVEDRSGKARSALATLSNAGVALRSIAVYPISHDKTIIADGKNVQTGSFNYSAAAAHKNSENVLVLWDSPELASAYLKHWQRNWDLGQQYKIGY